MKNQLFVFILGLILVSCSIEDDDSPSFYTEIMPIESVTVPDHFVQGNTYEIEVSYMRPSTCYQFYDFIYEVDGQERTIAVVNTVYNDSACTDNVEEVTVSYDFTVSGSGMYVFKFYQGADDNGHDQYHLIEIPVVDERLIN